MTSTPVSNDVASVMMNAASLSVPKSRTDNNFSDVLQKQTNPRQAEETAVSKSQTASRTKVEKSTEGKIREEATGKTKETDAKVAPEETLESSQEEALEKAEELAGQLLMQIADSLGMSVEEVQAVMEELGMEPAELLSSENLMQFLVTAGGETDSLSLLTNEKLYTAFQELSQTLEDGFAEIEQLTGMNREEVLKMLETAVAEPLTAAETEHADTVETDTKPLTEKEDLSKIGPENREVTGMKESGMTQEQSQSENMTGENRFADNGQNTFAQNLFQQSSTGMTNVTGTIPTGSYFSAETQMIMDQIMDFMKVNVGDGLTQLEMQLHPEELGTLQIKVAAKDGVITAQFTTENEVVKETLESQMVQLKEIFKEQGVKVEAIEVNVQTNSFERNLEQGRDNQPGENNESRPQIKVRRLNLRSLEEIPEEEMTEEDKLATEMMAENGNTVDYTV